MSIRSFVVSVAVLSMAFSWGDSDRADDPVSRGLALAQIQDRLLLVDFVRGEDPLTWRLDEEVYRDRWVLRVLEDFYADWSVPNRPEATWRWYHWYYRVPPGLSRRPSISRRHIPISDRFIDHPIPGCVRVAVGERSDLAERWDVTGVPGFVILSPAGEVVARHEGYLNAREMVDFLLSPVSPVSLGEGGDSGESSPPEYSSGEAEEPRPFEGEVPEAGDASGTRPPGEATDLYPGSSVSGEVSTANPEIWYRISFEESEDLLVTLDPESPDADLVMEAFDSEGRLIAENASGMGSLTIDAGGEPPVYIRVRGYDPSDASGFTLVVLNAEEDAWSLPDAYPIPIGTPVSGSIPPSGGASSGEAEVWYRIPVTAEGPLRFQLEGSNDGADLDLEVFSESGYTLGRAEGPTSDEDLSILIPGGSGEIFVRVYAFTPEEGSSFDLTVHSSDDTTGESAEDAVLLSEGDIIEGSIGAGGEDRYRIVPSGPGLISVILHGDEGDIDLVALNESGEVIGVSQGPRSNESILFEARGGETIFIRVFAYEAESPAGYTLWYREEER